MLRNLSSNSNTLPACAGTRPRARGGPSGAPGRTLGAAPGRTLGAARWQCARACAEHRWARARGSHGGTSG
eukprot:5273317-Alexandrium_andersonii.AAC.1